MGLVLGFKSLLRWSPETRLEQKLPPNLCLQGLSKGVCSLICFACESFLEFQVEEILCNGFVFTLELMMMNNTHH